MVDIVGEPMTPADFCKMIQEMYVEDENGVPLWKKIFGVEDSHGEDSDK